MEKEGEQSLTGVIDIIEKGRVQGEGEGGGGHIIWLTIGMKYAQYSKKTLSLIFDTVGQFCIEIQNPNGLFQRSYDMAPEKASQMKFLLKFV